VRPKPRFLQLPITAYTGSNINFSLISINTGDSLDVEVR